MRRADTFFYGLFMDRELLREKGIEPLGGEVALLEGFELRIGRRAALVPASHGRVYGVLFSLTLSELNELYADPGVRAYVPQAVLARLTDGCLLPALCYNLHRIEAAGEYSSEYAATLRAVGAKVGLPSEYVSSIR